MSGVELGQSSEDRRNPADPAVSLPGGVRVVRGLRYRLAVRLTESDGRTRAAVSGEIDLDCAPTLRHVLEESLRLAPGGLDVDLRDVEFFDCSGLNVLLRLRALADRLGTRAVVSGMSPAVALVLDVTGTSGLFPAPGRADEPRPPALSEPPWPGRGGRPPARLGPGPGSEPPGR